MSLILGIGADVAFHAFIKPSYPNMPGALHLFGPIGLVVFALIFGFLLFSLFSTIMNQENRFVSFAWTYLITYSIFAPFIFKAVIFKGAAMIFSILALMSIACLIIVIYSGIIWLMGALRSMAPPAGLNIGRGVGAGGFGGNAQANRNVGEEERDINDANAAERDEEVRTADQIRLERIEQDLENRLMRVEEIIGRENIQELKLLEEMRREIDELINMLTGRQATPPAGGAAQLPNV